MKQKISYYQQIKIVKLSLNKLIQKHKMVWNINFPNQDKTFILPPLCQLKDLG